MKVKITKEAKSYIKLADMPGIHEIIDSVKELDTKEFAKMACRYITANNLIDVLRADAEIAGNDRIYNYYSDNSGHFDVWINFAALVDDGFNGFIMGGCYLSDLFQLGADEATDKDLIGHMYVRRFTERQ